MYMEEYKLEDFNKCCSEDDSKLAYPRFSVVFLQTFCIHDALQFVVSKDAVFSLEEYRMKMVEIRTEAQNHAVKVAEDKRRAAGIVEEDKKESDDELTEGWKFKSLAEHVNKPIAYMYQDIEKQIFITSGDDDYKEKALRNPVFGRFTKKTLVSSGKKRREPVYVFDNSAVYRFSLKGFDFTVPIRSEKNNEGKYKIKPLVLKGHANVELSLFYGNTVSMAYKFYFDGYTASILNESQDAGTVAYTDHLITLLSCHLGAEYWSEKNKEEGSIDLLKEFNIDKIWIDSEGNPLAEGESFDYPSNGDKRVFNNVMIRYKKFLYKYCTAYKEGLSRREKLEHEKYRAEYPLTVSFDHHYAVVDIWGDVMHVNKGTERDVFDPNDSFNLSEPDIVNHIRDYHKPELIGLVTLYPSEWPYRDAMTYDYVCGKSIAIDTDDLVIAGTHVAAVVGTYDRRGAESEGNDWKAMAKVKAKYQVAWPEYLMILQFVLAKKMVISRMKDRMIGLIDAERDKMHKSSHDRLVESSKFSLDMTRQILQLDVVKYAKFASHRVMYDRTMERFKVQNDIDEIHDMSEMLNSNLQNMSTHEGMKTDASLNLVLMLVSIVSICEILFQAPESFNFWEKLPFVTDSPEIGAVLIAVIALIGMFSLIVFVCNLFKKIKR